MNLVVIWSWDGTFLYDLNRETFYSNSETSIAAVSDKILDFIPEENHQELELKGRTKLPSSFDVEKFVLVK